MPQLHPWEVEDLWLQCIRSYVCILLVTHIYIHTHIYTYTHAIIKRSEYVCTYIYKFVHIHSTLWKVGSKTRYTPKLGHGRSTGFQRGYQSLVVAASAGQKPDAHAKKHRRCRIEGDVAQYRGFALLPMQRILKWETSCFCKDFTLQTVGQD